MRFQWLGLGLGIVLLTAPASAEQDEVYKRYRRVNANPDAVSNFFSETFGGGSFTPFRSGAGKRKKPRLDPVEVANTGQDVNFAPPRDATRDNVRLLPQIEEGNLPYVPEKLELLRTARFEEAKPGEAVAGAIYDALLSGLAGAIRVTVDERQAILDYYRATSFKPLWIENNAIGDRAKKLEAVFAAADQEGLEPEEFVLPASDPSDAESLAEFDLKMTAAALKYARQASGGRLLPNRLSTYNDLKPERVKAAEALRILAVSPYPSDYLMRLHPTHPAYAAFKAALAGAYSRRNSGQAGPGQFSYSTSARTPGEAWVPAQRNVP
jgi:Scaffold domain